MKLITIVIMYSNGDNHPFLMGNTFAVSTDEDTRQAFRELAAPLIAAGLTIRDQLFVVAPDELMAQVQMADDEFDAEVRVAEMEGNHERYCSVCGCYMHFVDCWQCGGEGEFDAYDEDPINYAPGQEFEPCPECQGKGGYWECSSLPHEEGEARTNE